MITEHFSGLPEAVVLRLSCRAGAGRTGGYDISSKRAGTGAQMVRSGQTLNIFGRICCWNRCVSQSSEQELKQVRGVVWRVEEPRKLRFGHVKLEMSIQHPNGDVQQTAPLKTVHSAENYYVHLTKSHLVALYSFCLYYTSSSICIFYFFCPSKFHEVRGYFTPVSLLSSTQQILKKKNLLNESLKTYVNPNIDDGCF